MVRPTLQITSNCMRRATRQFRWKILQISIQVLLYDKLTAWLDLLYKLHRTVWAVLEIIFLYSEDICPFKSSFWSDIWQIGPDIIYWLTTPWRRELKMCWWLVRSSCPIIMWNWPDIFQIWSDNVRWPTVISSTDEACHPPVQMKNTTN